MMVVWRFLMVRTGLLCWMMLDWWLMLQCWPWHPGDSLLQQPHQIDGTGCVLHGARASWKGGDGVSDAVEFDIGVIGTPCQPLSRQRLKRSQPGSVKGHSKYHTTFDDFVQWISAYEPKAGCAEQVEGLDMAESTSTANTPLQRLNFGSNLFVPDPGHFTSLAGHASHTSDQSLTGRFIRSGITASSRITIIARGKAD